MKSAFTLLLTLLFSLCTTVLIAAFTLRHSGISAPKLKLSLVNQRVYNHLIDGLTDSLHSADSPTVSVQLESFIKNEVSPQYLRTKTETLIDDTSVWLTNSTAPPPNLSFEDLKAQLVQKNAKLVDELIKLESEYEALRPELEAAMQQNSDFAASANNTPLPNLRLSQMLNQNVSINLGPYLTPLKWLVLISTRYLYLLIVLTLTTIALLYTTHRTHQPFKALSKTFFVALILNVIPALIILILPGRISSIATNSLPPLVQSLLSITLTPLKNTYQTTVLFTLGGYLVACVVLFFIPTRTTSVKTLPPPKPKRARKA